MSDERREAKVMRRFGITDNGDLTWDGQLLPDGEWSCPQPFEEECRPGACNCSGIIDHWRAWGPCNRRPPHGIAERCFGRECESHS